MQVIIFVVYAHIKQKQVTFKILNEKKAHAEIDCNAPFAMRLIDASGRRGRALIASGGVRSRSAHSRARVSSNARTTSQQRRFR